MNHNLLTVKNLCLSFEEGHNVFHNINFYVKSNTINLISGESGCGKSSLLMCLARVILETIEGTIQGEIIFQGENIENKDVHYISGQIAYMFQDADSQLCTFTVEDEIAFALENLNMNPEDMEEKIDELLDLVGIRELKYRQLNQLSGGEQQKVALASILALDPQLILMDEPTANLDPVATLEIVQLVKKLRDDMGKTIIIIEHKVKEFSSIIDNIILFKSNGAELIEDTSCFTKEYVSQKSLPKAAKFKDEEKVVLKAEKINFAYENKRNILKEVSFELRKGEILAVVGHNGAGKSTLTKILMGLLKQETGEVLIGNKKLSKMKPREIGQNIGLVFQNPEHQFIKMRVDKELALGLELTGETQDTVERKTKEYLKNFNLEGSRENNPFSLSQGQKRRLSTASMMINGQKILILDEPTYGQDRENLIELLKLLYEINEEGTSILIITHDLELVYNCCHRIICLEKGRINKQVFDGPSLKAYFEERGVF
ncbi:MAG: energy-coupling factor transporter ATPase [Clostridium sp.]